MTLKKTLEEIENNADPLQAALDYNGEHKKAIKPFLDLMVAVGAAEEKKGYKNGWAEANRMHTGQPINNFA